VSTGAKVYVACRSVVKAQLAVEDIVKQTGIDSSQLPIMQLDLASLKSVRSFAASFKQSEQLSVMVNLFINSPWLLTSGVDLSSNKGGRGQD